jgi:hypothetical protein
MKAIPQDYLHPEYNTDEKHLITSKILSKLPKFNTVDQ